VDGILLRGTYNDVFFRRRAGENDSAAIGMLQKVSHLPEISEISETPELKEAAVVSRVQTEPDVNVAREVDRSPDATPDSKLRRASSVAPLEKDVPIESKQLAGEPGTQAVSVSGMKKEESVSLRGASQLPNETKDQTSSESKRTGGFFRRLFGRF
jgi:hypothetical protein